MLFLLKFMLGGLAALVLLVAFLSLYGGAGLWLFVLGALALALGCARPPKTPPAEG